MRRFSWQARIMSADGRTWAPRDPNASDEVPFASEKAIRIIAATNPVYLEGGDCPLLILRSALLPDVVFVFTRHEHMDDGSS